MNNGTIIEFATQLANVSGGGMSRVGGLVGQNGVLLEDWSVATTDRSNSHASGDVVVSGEAIGCGRTGRQQHVRLNHYRFIRQRRRHRSPAP